VRVEENKEIKEVLRILIFRQRAFEPSHAIPIPIASKSKHETITLLEKYILWLIRDTSSEKDVHDNKFYSMTQQNTSVRLKMKITERSRKNVSMCLFTSHFLTTTRPPCSPSKLHY
jgi:uncharacterized protein (DUF39 family)